MNCQLIFKACFLPLLFVVLWPAFSTSAEYSGAPYSEIDEFTIGNNREEFDSLRVERRGSVQGIVHRVEQGETLYSLSRRYGVTVEDITRANGGLNATISVGQEIFIPKNVKGQAVQTGPSSQASDTYHIVEIGQTLYSLSRVYGVKVEDIKGWNNLTSNELSAGQRLVIKRPMATAPVEVKTVSNEGGSTAANTAGYPYYIVQPSETLFSISRKFNVTVDEIKEWNNLSTTALSVGQQILVGKPATTGLATTANEDTPAREKKKDLVVNENGSLKQINGKGYTRDTTSVAGYEKVIEEGFAMVIENSPDTRKFLALHRTAPIGAILEVKNRMNDRSIYVRVVGNLPDTGVNNKVLIRLSQKAFERLGSPDPKVPVEVSYVP